MRIEKWLCALLLAALLACASLPAALAEDSGLEIIYDDADGEIVEPEEPDDEGDVPDEGDAVDDIVDAPAEAAGPEAMEGTGLVPEGVADALELARPVENVSCPEVPIDSDEAAARYIDQAMHAQPKRGRFMLRAAYASAAAQRLSGVNLRLYNALKPMIQDVAAGRRSDTQFYVPVNVLFEKEYYTAEELGLESFFDANGELTFEGYLAATGFIHIDISNVMSALLIDCPYDLYWYDKTIGVRWLGVGAHFESQSLCIDDYASGTAYFNFSVAQGYSKSGKKGTYETDSKRISAVGAAADNARRIVSDNQTLGDLAKLTAYKDAICDRVSYNRDAANGRVAYGDPWQLVWVFDDDPTTNVVCEGYSKAFQFLCDESQFLDGRVKGVVSVTGDMQSSSGNGGLHMWNLVNIDGINYLVDLTNCDTGNTGYPDQLFLVGYTYANGYGGYCFAAGSRIITYTFENRVTNLFRAEDLAYSGDPVGPRGTWNALGDLQWKISGQGMLYIMGEGVLPDFSADDPAPWKGEALTRVCFADGVQGIGEMAFVSCPNLTDVTIPNSLTAIADNAFDPELYLRVKRPNLHIESCINSAVIEYCQSHYIDCSVNHGATINEQAVEPTCTQTGLTHGSKCAVCGVVFVAQEVVPALGHITVNDAAVAATCTAAGKTAGSHCWRCGEVFKAQQTVPAKGHKSQTVKGYAATCTATGLTDGVKCSVCNTWITPQKTIAALGHSWNAPTYTWSSDNRTVMAKRTCKRNAGHVETETVSVIARQTRAASCTQNSITTYTTASFKNEAFKVQTKSIENSDKLGHSPQIVKGFPATYLSDGLTDARVCSRCKAVLTPHQTIARIPIRLIAVDRNRNNGTVVMAPGEQALLVPNFASGASVTGYKSAKAKIATVDGSGLVTASAEGKAKITVTTSDRKKKATITIQVVDPYKPKKISIAQGKKVTVKVGQSIGLTAVLNPTGARSALTWKTSKAAVATVDGNGNVTAHRKGRAKITVTTYNKKKATITVYVVE